MRKTKVGATGAGADETGPAKKRSAAPVGERRRTGTSSKQLTPAEGRPVAVPRRKRGPAGPTAAVAPGGSEQQLALRKPAPAKEQSGAAGEPLAAILAEIRGLKEAVGRLAPTAPVAASGVGLTSGDAPLEGAVDSLRRLLSELIEERTELLVRDLVKVRQEAAALPGEARAGIVEQLDRILESLGAARFEAEPMELVDPLIHSVAEERWQEGAPEGVIIETVRPGYRTARRLVVWKAAVAVNRRA